MSVEPTNNTAENSDAQTVRRRPRWLVLSAVSALVLIALVLGFYAVGTTPSCSLCHQSQATAMAKSPHSAVACDACHFASSGSFVGRIAVATRMLPLSLGGVRLTHAGRSVPNGACLSCHSRLASTGVVKKAGLTIDHTRCVTSAPCEDCHTVSIHGTATRLVRASVMTQCMACHAAKHVSTTCVSCHASRDVLKASGTEWKLTHGPDWKKLHGTGDPRTCVECHPAEYCKRCHRVGFPHPAEYGATHGTEAQTVGASACLTCHDQQRFCDGCHGMPMPHPANFLQNHSSISHGVDDARCKTCHSLDDCVECHVNHIHPGGPKAASNKGGGAQ